MTLQDIFDQLETGEFSALGIIGDDGKLEASAQPKVIRHINLAISDLYTRFNLSNRELVVEIQEDLTKYVLHSNHTTKGAATSSTKYIVDSEDDAFTDDLIAITEVEDSVGNDLGLNDTRYENPAITLATNTLQLTGLDTGELVTVKYRAAHTPIPNNESNPGTYYLGLPDHFTQAVLHYVAHRVHSSRLKEESVGLALQAKQMYEQACLSLDQWGMTNAHPTASKTLDAIDNEGWA